MLKTVLAITSKECVQKTVKRCIHNETITGSPKYVLFMEKKRPKSQRTGNDMDEGPGKSMSIIFEFDCFNF